jgi:hypothetical protein
LCKEAQSIGIRKWKEKTLAYGVVKHGTRAGYAVKCRCTLCVVAASNYKKTRYTERLRKGKLTHGTAIGYEIGCRCEKCSASHSVAQKNRLSKKKSSPLAEHLHGSRTGYAYGCRCPQCKLAISEYLKKRGLDPEIRKRISIKASARRKVYIRCEDKMTLKLLELQYRPSGYEVDHTVPISKGGEHLPKNLKYLSQKDNRKKHNNESYVCKDPVIEWKTLIPDWEKYVTKANASHT